MTFEARIQQFIGAMMLQNIRLAQQIEELERSLEPPTSSGPATPPKSPTSPETVLEPGPPSQTEPELCG